MSVRLESPPLTPQGAPQVGGSGVDAAKLAQLMSVFNDVTSQLHETHDRLHTEVHRLRSELAEANDQLERSRRLAALGQMAAGIAHEVRNPLGCIQLYAQMLEQDLGALPEQKQVASKISVAVSGLEGVVGDVLTFAREIDVRREDVDGVDLLHRACALAWPGGPDEAISLSIPDEASSVRISCDPRLLQQALLNLIRNGVEVMQEIGGAGHRLTLGVELVDDEDRGRREAVVRVSDTGGGMGQEVIDRMFNPFFTTRHTGTGLGLA
ncbi:MAG: sensor histidine kinase, partial [Phycisphaerales bacterium]